MPNIFPESKIAKEYKIGKTKASCILNESLAPHFLQETVQIIKNDFYSLSTDGSNDTELEKINPLTVPLYDSSKSRVDTRFLDMCCTSGQNSGTAAAIFQKIDNVMIKLQLPWKNCVAFSLDNTSTNPSSQELHLKITISTLWDAHVISFTTLHTKDQLDLCAIQNSM